MTTPTPDDHAHDVKRMQDALRAATKAAIELGEAMDRRTPADYRTAGLEVPLGNLKKIVAHLVRQAD